ncbi:hypothetical protein D3C87_1604840 [compost metagenome]
MDMTRIAAIAVEALVKAIGERDPADAAIGAPVTAENAEVPMQLVVRQSSAAPPGTQFQPAQTTANARTSAPVRNTAPEGEHQP